MKFTKGRLVEVFQGENDSLGSWFPGKVVLVDDDNYTVSVRYKFLTNRKGDHFEEMVHKRDVRPQPPNENGITWVVGDTCEAFDMYSWRVGKISHLLEENRVVIRFLGSNQLKECHNCNTRTRHTWANDKWITIREVDHNERRDTNHSQRDSKRSCRMVNGAPLKAIRKDTRSFDKDRTAVKRKHVLVRRSHKKRKSMLDMLENENTILSSRPLLKQVDNTFPKVKMDAKCMNISTEIGSETEKTQNCFLRFSPLLSSEDSNQSSVASCSSDENIKPSKDEFGNSNAESSIPSSMRNELLHELELHAYKSTIKALYASGPLSWEQESLLTNLRMSLNISNDEHLLQLKYLLSSPNL